MKKAYIAPTMEAIKIDTTSILAASQNEELPVVGGSTDTDSPGGQDGRDNQPSNPNLWDQLW